MCFSAEASFTAAAVLTVIGIATIKKVSSKNQWFLALIPLFFAFQQFSEGVLWVALRNNTFPSFWSNIAAYIYMLFAYVFWPTWIPLSTLTPEKIPERRKLLSIVLILGFILSLSNLAHLMMNHVNASIVFNTIHYDFRANFHPTYYLISLISYAVIVILSIVLSSGKNSLLHGFVIALSFALAIFFYSFAFASAWCFFAAIYSFVVYKVITDLNVKGN